MRAYSVGIDTPGKGVFIGTSGIVDVANTRSMMDSCTAGADADEANARWTCCCFGTRARMFGGREGSRMDAREKCGPDCLHNGFFPARQWSTGHA